MDQGDNIGNEFEDSIPNNTDYVCGSTSASSGTATHNDTENRIEWNGSIAIDSSVTITFKVVIALPLPNGTIISNQGTVNWDSDSDGGNDSQEPTDDPDTPEDDDPTKSVVTSVPFIEATKTDTDVNEGPYLEPGDTLLYTVAISNTGNMDQGNNAGNEFEDVIPVNTTFDNSYAPTATSGTATYNAGLDRIEWNGIVAAGSCVTITFRVILDFPLANGTVISNQGTVNWDSDGDDCNDTQEPTDDSDTPEDDDPTLSVVIALPLIEASKYDQLRADIDGNGMASPGDSILYTIIITNYGKANATNVTFSDIPDPNTALAVGSVITTQGAIISGNNVGDTSVGVNIGTMPIGSSVYITFKITIDDPLPVGVTQIANQGYVSSNELPDEPTDDPHTPVDDDPTRTTVAAIPVIEVFKIDSLVGDIFGDNAVGAGDTLLYKVNIFNSGNTAATGVTFTDTPDTNTALVIGSVTTSQGIITVGNNPGDTDVSVNIDTILSQGSVTIKFLVSVNDPLPIDLERIANQGYASSNELPPEFTDDSDTPQEKDSTLTAIGVPDIDLSDYSHDYGQVPAGDCSPWTLIVCNVGSAALVVYSIESLY